MSLPNIRELKKLAAACRKLGISHFKCESFEFTLSGDFTKTIKAPKRNLASDSFYDTSDDDTIIPGDMPKEEDLLFWSSGATVNDPTEASEQ